MTGLHLDEDRFGCRYLLAEAVVPVASKGLGIDLGSKFALSEVNCQHADQDFEITDAGWAPRHEDPTDKDLTRMANASWVGLQALCVDW